MTHRPNRRRFIQISAAAAGLATLPASVSANKMNLHRWRGAAMGADAALIFHLEDHGAADRLTAKCLIEVRRLERIFSLYQSDSAISLLNRYGTLTNPSNELVELLSRAMEISEQTNGAFDVTVQPLWQLHASYVGHKERMPTQDEISAASSLVDYRNVQVSPEKIHFLTPGMAMTLNGIAQGYITDCITRLLRQAGMTDILVNMGEIRGLGHHPNGRPWQVSIAGHDNIVRPLTDQAIATSAADGLIFGRNPEWHHVFDTLTGHSATSWRSVSVIADNATTADALSTAFMSMRKHEIRRVADRHRAKVYTSADGRTLAEL